MAITVLNFNRTITVKRLKITTTKCRKGVSLQRNCGAVLVGDYNITGFIDFVDNVNQPL